MNHWQEPIRPVQVASPSLSLMENVINRSVAIRFISNKVGNGLFARSDFREGDVIVHVDEPYLLVPLREYLDKLCYYCFSECLKVETPRRLKACTGCHTVTFCSKECQAASWKRYHKSECKIFRQLRAEQRPALPTSVRGILQVLLRHQKDPSNEPDWSRLMTHKDEIRAKQLDWDNVELQARAAVHYAGLPMRLFDFARNILLCINTNAFSASHADGISVGLVFEPLLASTNHSCLPNAFVAFHSDNSRSLSMRALRPIRNGEEIMISYVDVTLPLAMRQRQIQKNWLFTCDCPRCRGDWSVYTAFLRSPCREANKLSIVANHEELERHASKLSSNPLPNYDDFEKSYQECYSSLTVTERATPAIMFNLLKRFFDKMDLLVESDILAISPYDKMILELVNIYQSALEYEAAIIPALILVFRIHPYQFPEPWHPARITALRQLADLMREMMYGITSLPGLVALQDLGGAHIDMVPALYAILLLIAEYAPKSHGDQSDLVKEVRRDIENVEFRMQIASKPIILTMKLNGIREGDGNAAARKYWRQLEALADVSLMYKIVQTVNCMGTGHVSQSAGDNTSPGGSLRLQSWPL